MNKNNIKKIIYLLSRVNILSLRIWKILYRVYRSDVSNAELDQLPTVVFMLS